MDYGDRLSNYRRQNAEGNWDPEESLTPKQFRRLKKKSLKVSKKTVTKWNPRKG